MKRLSLLSALLLLLGLPMMAGEGESLSVGETKVPKGHSAMMAVMFNFNPNHDYVSYQFNVNLPEGISLVAPSAGGKVSVELGDGQETDDAVTWSSDLLANASPIMKAYSNPSTPIGGADNPLTEGVLVYIPIQADASLEAGTELQGTLTTVTFVHSNSVGEKLADVDFTITVADNVILDENYTWTPFETDDDVDIEVKRTIKANEWSTLCLPFDMDGEQFTNIFGEDAQLMELPTGKKDTAFDVEEGNDGVTSITIHFDEVDVEEDGFAANTPYLIKTTKDITEFTTTATIAPDEADAVATWTKGSGSSRKTIDFIGTYKAGTFVPDGSLFLSGNNFWYSVGLTKIKAYRAYFTLNKELADKTLANARILMSFDDNGTTELREIQVLGENDGWYTISGQKLDKKPTTKGVYIHGGEKVIIKSDRRK